MQHRAAVAALNAPRAVPRHAPKGPAPAAVSSKGPGPFFAAGVVGAVGPLLMAASPDTVAQVAQATGLDPLHLLIAVVLGPVGAALGVAGKRAIAAFIRAKGDAMLADDDKSNDAFGRGLHAAADSLDGKSPAE